LKKSQIDPDSLTRLYDTLVRNCDKEVVVERINTLKLFRRLKYFGLPSYQVEELLDPEDGSKSVELNSKATSNPLVLVTEILILVTSVSHLYESISQIRPFLPEEERLKEELESLLMACNEMVAEERDRVN
jgi:hypothetical protein